MACSLSKNAWKELNFVQMLNWECTNPLSDSETSDALFSHVLKLVKVKIGKKEKRRCNVLLKGASGYLPNHMKYFGVWCTSMSNNKEMVIEYRFKS